MDSDNNYDYDDNDNSVSIIDLNDAEANVILLVRVGGVHRTTNLLILSVSSRQNPVCHQVS